MSTFPKHIVELLRKLHEAPSLVARLAGREDPRVDVIRELAASGTIEVVPYLSPFIVESNKLASTAMNATAHLVSRATNQQLLRLDEKLRTSDWWWGWAEWRRTQPGQIWHVEVSEQNRAAVFGVLSCHPSGYVRETAVQRLTEIRSGAEMPFLLMRLNDWVAKVHDISRAAVLDRMHANQFEALFDNLDLVFWLEECRRHDHAAIVQGVVRRLASIDSAERLANTIRNGPRFVRRRAYSAAINADLPGAARIVGLGIDIDDDVLRLWATRDAKTHLSDSELEQILPALLADRFQPVRREALHCVVARFPDKANSALTDALLDASLALRELARFYLRKSVNFDVAAYYRQNLNRSGSLEPAIAGLGETGDANDERLIIPFLSDERAKIRAAAVRSTGLLSKGRPGAALFDLIQDASKKVASEACNALERSIDAIELPDLASLFRKEGRTSVRMAILDLIDLKDTWATMPDLVEAAASDDSEVAQAAQRKILGKFNRVFTIPSDDQRDAILSALQRNAGSVPAKFATEFSKWLASRV
jgi:HEAT repeat protein